jgi:phosphoserine aminotransferase
MPSPAPSGVLFSDHCHFSPTTDHDLDTGLRASLYNAITEEQTDKLVAYIREFIESQG